MSQGRYIDLRLKADHYSRRAQFCFDQKDWSNAIDLFQNAIDETRHIPAGSLNKDDYLLLALATRDMVWPSFRLDKVSSAFRHFRHSLLWFSKAVSKLTVEQASAARYRDVFSSYYPIILNVLRRLKPYHLTAENRHRFDNLRQVFADFMREMALKFPDLKISREWEEGIRWPAIAASSQSGLFDRQTTSTEREKSEDTNCMRPGPQ